MLRAWGSLKKQSRTPSTDFHDLAFSLSGMVTGVLGFLPLLINTI